MDNHRHCNKRVRVRNGQCGASTDFCALKVSWVDPLGRGWCARHEPDEERKTLIEENAKVQPLTYDARKAPIPFLLLKEGDTFYAKKDAAHLIGINLPGLGQRAVEIGRCVYKVEKL